MLSAAAALLIKIAPEGKDLPAVFAGVAALSVTIAGIGRFEAKWKTNRQTRSSLEQLEIEFLGPDVDREKVTDQLKEIIRTHNDGIMG